MQTPQLEQQQVNDYLKRMEDLVYNISMTRGTFFSDLLDRRAKVDKSCGYPPLGSPLSIEAYRELYDRFSIANRVVSLWPKECWQVQPKIFENEEQGQTEFEQAWEAICSQVGSIVGGGPNYYQDALGSGMWEYIARADELSGIGTFGIILLGLADGKLLEQPVDGSPPDGNPYVVPNIVSSGMPAGARVIPGAFGGQAGVDYVPTVGPGNIQDSYKNIYGDARPEYGAEASMMDEYQSVSRDIYGSATQNPLSSVLGTDAQYRGIQFTPGFYPDGDPYGPLNPYAGPGYPREMLRGGKPVNGKNGKTRGPVNSLLFLRIFDESLVQVVQYEADLRNPRFGQPIMYLVTLNDPRYPHTGIGLPLATLRVHWSRIVHLADCIRSSEIFAMPRMQPVFNNLLDLRKLYGGSAEMYWQGALPGLSLETHPNLGADFQANIPQMQEMLRQYTEGLERWLYASGMTVRTLAPTVVDPSNQIQSQIDAICIQLAVPKRVFMGAERGELASTQDDANWNDRLRHRQSIYLTPRVICPMINRLIMLGILPQPKGYSIKWPDLDSQTEATKATIAVQKVQALVSFTGGVPESIMTPIDFYTRIMGHDEETAKQIVEEAELQQAMAQMASTPSGMMEGQQPQPQPGVPGQGEGPGSSESQLVTHSNPKVARIKKALDALSEDDEDGLLVWVNPETNQAVIDGMDWHNGDGAKIVGRVAEKVFGRKNVHYQNEGSVPSKKEGWIKLNSTVFNASTPNLRGGQIGSKEEPIGAYKEPNISQDSEGGKWLTVVSSKNPAIVHHVPIGIALEKHTATTVKGPIIGPMGQVIEYLGKTRAARPTGKRTTGG